MCEKHENYSKLSSLSGSYFKSIIHVEGGGGGEEEVPIASHSDWGKK